ncbi:MAG: class I SAM-dependent RNA methyltransferase [Propionibacteriaceae bacterium]
MTDSSTYPPTAGTVVGPVEVGPVAHGGHCVARLDGRVIFVRHALPGESVSVRITDTTHDRFWRGDAVRVHRAAPDRTVPPCPIAGPGGCGGCDFQHATPVAQRTLKAAVVAEQVSRLAGLDWPVEVEEVPAAGVHEGRGWRRRMRYRTRAGETGRPVPGLHGHRSHTVIALPEQGCLIADPQVALDTAGWDRLSARLPAGEGHPAGTELLGAAAAEPNWYADGELIMGTEVLVEQAANRSWQVAADGFWQVHPGAADALVSAVLSGLDPQPGEHAFDLFCGVGLFAGALADRGCRVWGVEADRRAIDFARANLADLPPGQARFTSGRVDRVLGRLPKRTDLVVLDPPRTGAGRRVVEAVIDRGPRAIALVACDPAALGRDLGVARRAGYRVAELRAFDLFPMTHHVEAVALLVPGSAPVSTG